MDYFVHVGERRIQVELDGAVLRVDGEPVEVELSPEAGNPVRSARVGDRSLRVLPNRTGRGDWTLEVEGVSYRAHVLDVRQEAAFNARESVGATRGPPPLRAPMPGLVIRVEVSAGDLVDRGRGIIIVEAMKMENELKAEVSARVARVLVEEGATVEKDQLLVEFEVLEEEEG